MAGLEGLNQYLFDVRSAVRAEDGLALQRLLRESGERMNMLRQFSLARLNLAQIRGACNAKLPDRWSAVFGGLLSSVYYTDRQQWFDAFGALLSKDGDSGAAWALRSICTQSPDSNTWLVRPLVEVCTTVQNAARRASVVELEVGEDTPMEQCARFLQPCFQIYSVKGEFDRTRRLAPLAIATLMIKAHFQLNTISSVKGLLRTIDGPAFGPFDEMPKAYRVTYKYFCGRIAIFDDDYKVAEENLEYAFRFNHPRATANTRRILRFLVPLKMLRGCLPSEKLLHDYQLPEYRRLAEGVRTGNVALVDACLEEAMADFVQAGTLLLVEKLKLAAYRTLFKRSAAVWAESSHLSAGKEHQVPLWLFQKGLEAQRMDCDMDEVECVLATLIHSHYVKGYISHKNKVVVLSKVEPFPPLSQSLPSGPD